MRHLPLGGRARSLAGVFVHGRLLVWLYDHPEVLLECGRAYRYHESGRHARQGGRPGSPAGLVARPDAACPRCGTPSSRVKERRTQRVRDALSYERPTTLVWAKRRFGCDTPGCVGKFTESTGAVVPRRRATAPLCAAWPEPRGIDYR